MAPRPPVLCVITERRELHDHASPWLFHVLHLPSTSGPNHLPVGLRLALQHRWSRFSSCNTVSYMVSLRRRL